MKALRDQTYGRREILQEEKEFIFVADDGTEERVINLYPMMQYQKTEGFGGALTDAVGFVFALLNETQKIPCLGHTLIRRK